VPLTCFTIREFVQNVQNLLIIVRAVGPEMRSKIELRTPVLPMCGGFGHKRINTGSSEGLNHLFHLPRTTLAVYYHAADHIVRELMKVKSGETFVE
jgi:hypothetical protein